MAFRRVVAVAVDAQRPAPAVRRVLDAVGGVLRQVDQRRRCRRRALERRARRSPARSRREPARAAGRRNRACRGQPASRARRAAACRGAGQRAIALADRRVEPLQHVVAERAVAEQARLELQRARVERRRRSPRRRSRSSPRDDGDRALGMVELEPHDQRRAGGCRRRSRAMAAWIRSAKPSPKIVGDVVGRWRRVSGRAEDLQDLVAPRCSRARRRRIVDMWPQPSSLSQPPTARWHARRRSGRCRRKAPCR